MSEDSELEKTEPASERRLERARADGDIPRSRELGTIAVLLSSGVAIWTASGALVHTLKNVLIRGLQFSRDAAFTPSELFRIGGISVASVFQTLLPLGVMIALASVVAPLLLGGWVFTTKALVPDFAKLNPLRGLSNMVSKHSAVELAKAVIKTVIVGIVAYVVVRSQLDQFVRLSEVEAELGAVRTAELVGSLYVAVVGALFLIAAGDVVYQIWHYGQKHRMTKQELRDEAKEADGNPEIKAKIRHQQREMSRRRMMADVPTADVVVTNPTHYAVALKYAEGGTGAPRVVAKGTDHVASKIRELAKENGVLLMEAPPLARALHKHTEIGDEIPETLYSAVAEVLAYVFQLRHYHREGGATPGRPASIAVPDGMDPANTPDSNRGEAI